MRTFTEATYNELARKPEHIRDARTCYLHGTDPASMPLATVASATVDALNDLAAKAEETDFAVYCQRTEDVFLVNTEGYDYCRYLGRFSTKDAKAILDREPCDNPKPVVEFSGFEPMDDTMRMGYAGCEGEADIAFVADPNDGCPWQFDLVVDEEGLQVHHQSTSHSPDDIGCSWGVDMADREIARAIGARVADAILQLGLDARNALDDAALVAVSNTLGHFGLARL